ncbi:unnamed protein product [Taenia asiatica]|uniref:BHLH domain-containing protein n=1 Tax=Taenia asiatica TaxID=60517 RepID=A0A0R3WBL1_TAEAS|nr:unnamed protein product [Taenia asiatica]
MSLQQQEQGPPPLRPLYVIPLGGAAATPIKPIVVDLCKTRPFPQPPVPSIAPKIDVSTTSSPKKRQPLFPLDDREMKRRIVKQYMERRRRACISDKLSALHNLAVSLIGEKPQQQSHQRLEITDILNQCVSVLEGLSEFVKNEPELQAKMRRLKLPSAKESSGEQRRRRQSEASTSKVMKNEMEVEKENAMPRASAFTPVGRHRMVTTSTPLIAPLLLSPPPCQRGKCLSVTRKRKRESTDSGLNSPASSSAGPSSTSSFSSPIPSASTSSSTRLEDTQLLKRSRKSSPSNIWRPYRD